MPLHEDEALKKHPGAKEFRPVKIWGNLVGWTFQFPLKEGAATLRYSWVTCDGQVSSDRLEDRVRAMRNLKAYRRSDAAGKTYNLTPNSTHSGF